MLLFSEMTLANIDSMVGNMSKSGNKGPFAVMAKVFAGNIQVPENWAKLFDSLEVE